MTRVRFFLTSVSVAALFLIATQTAQAANGDFDSRATGNWNVASTWIKQLSGTASFNSSSMAVTGVGTSFTTQLVVGDVLMLQASSGTVQGTVASITNNTNLTLTANAATTASGAYGKQATPTSADGVITILNGHTVTVTAAVTVDQVTVNAGGQVVVNSGVTWTVANGGGDDLTVNGTVTVTGTITGPNAVTINSGGTVTVTGAMNLTTGTPTLTVSGTLTVDGTISGPNLVTVNAGGMVTVSATGTLNANTGNPTISVSGTVAVAGTITGPNAVTINNGGIVNVTGIMNLTDGNPTLTVSAGGNLNYIGGSTTISSVSGVVVAGTITMSGSSSLSVTRGNGGTLVVVNSLGQISMADTSQIIGAAGSNIVATVLTMNSGSTLIMGPSSIIGGPGRFSLGSGASMQIGSTAGITLSGATGNVQVGDTRTYNTGANYTYNNGTTSQNTGNGFTGANNLTIANTGGDVTLTSTATVTGVLALNNGNLVTGANILNQGSASTSTGTTDVVGNVRRTHAFAAATSYAFGNPNVTVNFTGAGANPSSININLAKSAPSNFTNAVNRTYDITLPGTAGAGFSATLRLHYLTSELNGNTEGTLTLWKETLAVWSSQGNTGQNTTPPDNWVEFSPVTGFSRWALSSNAPTDVAMVNMKATRFDDRILLEWQTGYEIRNLGFNIYREQKGSYTRINPEPVAGSALLFGPKIALRAGFAYAWWDKGVSDCGSKNADCENTRYWIQDLDLSGHSSMHGPFGVEQSTSADAASAAGKEQATLLGAIGNNAARLGSSAPVERLATLLKPSAASLSLQAAVASQQAVKLSIKHEGWYRVEQSDLVAAGFPTSADAPNLQLFVDGQEVPILVTTSTAAVGKGSRATSAAWDGIEFYGIGIDSAFTDSHVYWLVAGSQKGLRINIVPSGDGTAAPFTFAHAVERRDKVVYFSALKNGGGEKFFGPLIYNAQPVDQPLDLKHVASTGLATLDVGLQGFTDAPHSVRVLLNGSELGTVLFTGVAKGTAQYSIPQSSLVEGSNQVQLISPAGYSDISVVEYVRMTYQHTNIADGNALRFPGTGGEQATISGFTNGTVRVVDITDAATPEEVNASVNQDGSEYSVTVTVPGAGARTLLAFAVDQKKTPASLVANQPSSWRSPKNGATYIAVTRKDLVDSLQVLIKQRRNQGLKVSVVDIEDVYDEFSFGNKTPQALKDFFSYAKTSWKIPPRFALLAGDATYDPKNYTGAGDNDLVPTKLAETGFTETATDDWLVDFDGDFIPDIAIGRLPVRSAQESAELAAKIVRYDGSEANRRVVMVADHNDGHDFEAADSQLQALLPATLSVTDIRRGQVGDSTARTQLLDALNMGAKLVNYYGHGSTLVWTNASILTAADAASLANTDRLALFDAMTCFNGFFHDVSIDSLGEALLKSPGGAIAVWASTGMTDPGGQVLMNEEAIRQLFSGAGLTIGEVAARAKAATNNADVRRTWVLLGDPATKLK